MGLFIDVLVECASREGAEVRSFFFESVCLLLKLSIYHRHVERGLNSVAFFVNRNFTKILNKFFDSGLSISGLDGSYLPVPEELKEVFLGVDPGEHVLSSE